MNRKEMTCAAVGALVGAAGCSPAMKSLAVPVANAEGTMIANAPFVQNAPHLKEVLLSLISGTTKDIGTAVFRLSPDSGWSITSSDPRLHVEVQREHVAIVTAPEHKEVQFVATATISHVDGAHFDVRCHVEAGCTDKR
jgi:hypothetical protein